MKAPDTRIFIHNPGRIAFGPVGTVELTLAQVEQLHAFHMGVLTVSFDGPTRDHHLACARTFRHAMADHGRWRTGAATGAFS